MKTKHKLIQNDDRNRNWLTESEKKDRNKSEDPISYIKLILF